MPSYSVSLNAVVSPTGGSVARLDAVCAAGPTSNYVVVATAANLAVAGGRFRGVALEAASGNQAIQIVDFGTIDLLTTVLTGTGEYVSVNATGQLERTVSVTAATIGTLENGTVHVNVALSMGAATVANATAIQGVPLGTISATPRGAILASDGVEFRSKSWMPDLRDFFRTYGGADDGSTPCDDALDAFALALNQSFGSRNVGEGIISTPTTAYLITRPWKLYSDQTTNFLRYFTIHGTAGRRSGATMFYIAIPPVFGTAADITDYGNGGSGQNTQTITLGAGSAAVTTATASTWIGRWIRLWNTATAQHSGEFIIVGVPSDGVVRISNQSAGVLGADANDGAICWRILQPGVDLRSSHVTLENLTFEPKQTSGTRVDCYMELNFAPGPFAVQSQSTLIKGCNFATKNGALYRGIDGIWIARSFVPTSADNYGTVVDQTSIGFGGPGLTNGRGDYIERGPYQVDTVHIIDTWVQAERVAVGFYSRTAQAKEIMLRDCPLSARVGCGSPRTRYLAGTWTADGSAHWDIESCSFSSCDMPIQYGGTGSARKRVVNCYGENNRRFYFDGHNILPQSVSLVDNYVTGPGHPSGEYAVFSGTGPYKCVGGAFAGADGVPTHIVLGTQTIAANGPAIYHFDTCEFIGTTSNTAGKRARRSSTFRGPYKFTPGVDDVFTITTDIGAQNVTVSLANFTTAGVTSPPVTLDEVWPYQLGLMLDYFTKTGTSTARCWGEGDDAFVHIESPTGGALSAITVTGTAATKLGFSAAPSSGLAPLALENDTLGWMATSRNSGAVCDINLTITPSCRNRGYGSPAINAMPSLYGKNYTPNTAFGPARTEVGGTFTLTAAATTTVAETRTKASTRIRLTPTNAAAATLMGSAQALYVSARVANTSFDVTTASGVAAAGTETFEYTMVESL